MSIFSRRGQVNPPEDLDQGYEHGYYQQTERRPDSRPDDRYQDSRYDRRPDDRYQDSRYEDSRYDRRPDDRYEDSRYDRRPDDRYEDSRYDRRPDDRYEDSRYEGGREDDYVARPARRRDSVYEEEDAPGYTERTRDSRRTEAPVAPQNKGTAYFTPETCQDCREDIVCDLADSHAVVVDLSLLDGKNMTRLLDYIMGAVQALGADIRRLEGNYILLTPAGVEVSDDEIELPEAEEDFEEDYAEDEMYDEVAEEA